jgi:hypothetical protein
MGDEEVVVALGFLNKNNSEDLVKRGEKLVEFIDEFKIDS